MKLSEYSTSLAIYSRPRLLPQVSELKSQAQDIATTDEALDNKKIKDRFKDDRGPIVCFHCPKEEFYHTYGSNGKLPTKQPPIIYPSQDLDIKASDDAPIVKPQPLPYPPSNFNKKIEKYFENYPVTKKILADYRDNVINNPDSVVGKRRPATFESFEKYLSGRPRIAERAKPHMEFFQELFNRIEKGVQRFPVIN